MKTGSGIQNYFWRAKARQMALVIPLPGSLSKILKIKLRNSNPLISEHLHAMYPITQRLHT